MFPEDIPYETKDLNSVYDLHHYNGPLDKIWSLSMKGNPVTQLPLRLAQMVNLQSVDLGGIASEELEDAFEALARLPKLMDLKYYLWRGETFPRALGELNALRRLTLHASECPPFPASVAGMANLRAIHLDAHTWSPAGDHMAALGALPNLHTVAITLRENHPSGLAHLTQVKALHILRLDRPIEGLAQMAALETLRLEYLHEEKNLIADLGDVAHLKQLRSLQVRTWGELFFSKDWENLGQLEEVEFSHCDLTAVPRVIATAPALKRLNLRDNRLKSLPSWVGDMPALEEIDLSKNQLRSLPPKLSQVRHLQRIRLTDNQFKIFPSVLSRHPSVKEILLDDNRLKTFPKTALECPALELLDLRKNELQELPDIIWEHPLAVIQIGGNTVADRAGFKIHEVVAAVGLRYRGQACRPTLLALALGNIPLALKHATIDHLVTALQDENEKLRAFALTAMEQWLPDPFRHPSTIRTVAILGKVKGISTKALESKLQTHGITVLQNKPADADLVVYGETPSSKLLHCHRSGKPLCSIAQLIAHLDTFAVGWLRTAARETPAIDENLRRLWDSDTLENIQLVFEMVAEGGLPESLSLSEILGKSLFCPNSDIRKLCTKYVQAKASPEWRAFLIAHARKMLDLNNEKMREHAFRYIQFLGIEGRGFAKAAFRYHKALKICMLPYMTGKEIVKHWTDRGTVTLPWTPLRTLPKGLFEITGLKRLSLSGMYLGKLPPGWGALRQLTYLNMNRNSLSELPDDLAALQSLEVLELSGNAFAGVPAQLRSLTRLQELYLTENPLTDLPSWLPELRALKVLYIYRARLQSFPEVLHHMPHLRELAISLHDSRLPEEAILAGVFQMRSLESLKIKNVRSSQLPETIDLPQLTSLELTFSDHLRELPASIGKITSLKSLELQYCENLEKLPATIGNLVALETLNLKKTKVQRFPASIAKLQNLQTIIMPNRPMRDKDAIVELLLQLPRLRVVAFDWLYDPKLEAAIAEALPHVSLVDLK